MPQSSLLAWLSGNPSAQITPSKLPNGTEEIAGQATATVSLPSEDTKLHHPSKATTDEESLHLNKTTTISKSPQLPRNITFRPCAKADLPDLKRLHTLLFPIPFGPAFFQDILTVKHVNRLTLLAFWHDTSNSPESGRLVGAIRCRVLNDSSSPPTSGKDGTMSSMVGYDNEPILYLSTLALLSPYRGHGIASHMLDMVTKRAVTEYGIMSVGAHVWEANAEALEWYRKRGFREVRREEGYYRRLNPQGAVVVLRRVGVRDLVGD